MCVPEPVVERSRVGIPARIGVLLLDSTAAAGILRIKICPQTLKAALQVKGVSRFVLRIQDH